MLHNLTELENFKISATDGDIGHIKDFYFEDDTWVVRYFVVETGRWLSSRKVLISPISVQQPDWQAHTLPVSISMEKVKLSPDFDSDKPVSRQNEMQYLGYYGFQNYWDGSGMWGEGLYPYVMAPGFAGYGIDHIERLRELEAYVKEERARHRNDDPHLRSSKAVTGYHIHATDGDIGQVSGFLVDDRTWAIRYLVIDTSNWWVGHKVLIAPPWIKEVRWSDRTVAIDLTRELIKNAPTYDSTVNWSREQDIHLHGYYGSSGYGIDSNGQEKEI